MFEMHLLPNQPPVLLANSIELNGTLTINFHKGYIPSKSPLISSPMTKGAFLQVTLNFTYWDNPTSCPDWMVRFVGTELVLQCQETPDIPVVTAPEQSKPLAPVVATSLACVLVVGILVAVVVVLIRNGKMGEMVEYLRRWKSEPKFKVLEQDQESELQEPFEN